MNILDTNKMRTLTAEEIDRACARAYDRRNFHLEEIKLSVDEFVAAIDNQNPHKRTLNIRPLWQRPPCYTSEQKASLVLGIYRKDLIPPMVYLQDQDINEHRYSALDAVQRTAAIYEYVKSDQFKNLNDAKRGEFLNRLVRIIFVPAGFFESEDEMVDYFKNVNRGTAKMTAVQETKATFRNNPFYRSIMDSFKENPDVKSVLDAGLFKPSEKALMQDDNFLMQIIALVHTDNGQVATPKQIDQFINKICPDENQDSKNWISLLNRVEFGFKMFTRALSEGYKLDVRREIDNMNLTAAGKKKYIRLLITAAANARSSTKILLEKRIKEEFDFLKQGELVAIDLKTEKTFWMLMRERYELTAEEGVGAKHQIVLYGKIRNLFSDSGPRTLERTSIVFDGKDALTGDPIHLKRAQLDHKKAAAKEGETSPPNSQWLSTTNNRLKSDKDTIDSN